MKFGTRCSVIKRVIAVFVDSELTSLGNGAMDTPEVAAQAASTPLGHWLLFHGRSNNYCISGEI